MSDVFISYSRKNSDFAHKLDQSLTAAKRDVWIDWQDIARGEDWWRSIQTGIDSTDTATGDVLPINPHITLRSR